MIVPSIDLSGGKVVQLIGGERKALEFDDAEERVAFYGRFGEVAVIDIDAARGTGSNLALVKRLCRMAHCRVGGGIRSEKAARRLLAAGARSLILGTAAQPGLLKRLPRDTVMVAADVRNGEVLSHGWRKGTGMDIERRIRETESCCSGYLVTAVAKEGRLKGPDWPLIERVRKLTGLPLTVAGGFATVKEVRRASGLGCNVQLGMSIYTGCIDLAEAFAAILKFDRLIPTVVMNTAGQPLMLAYSSAQSLKEALRTGRGVYYSRSRRRLWRKGEESGNTQRLVRVRHDCDRDALVFVVEQKGVSCHRGTYSCFGERDFGLDGLHGMFRQRVKEESKKSYTLRLLRDRKLLREKLLEEAEEVAAARTFENVRWEAADLLYFLAVKMFAAGVTFDDVMGELRSRQR